MRSGILLAFLLLGCGGTAHVAIGPPPGPETKGALAGPLCNAQRCKCRTGPDDGGAGFPDDPKLKRFEVKMYSPQPLWASYRDGQLYKNAEAAEQCFYIDLPPGQVPFKLRGSNPDGVSAKWTISELGAKTKSWYDTFTFVCGYPGVCSFESLDIAKDEYGTAKRNLRDPCGSVKAKGISWDTGHAPDQLHPSELEVRVTLDIYKHVPNRPHGDATCGTGRATTTEGDDAPPPATPAP